YLRYRGLVAPEEAADAALRSGDLATARWLTLGWALVATVGALFVNQLGTVVKAMGIINGFFVGPLLSVFLLGFLTKRANSFGAFAGMIAGTALTAVVARVSPISWLWYGPVGCVFTLLVGYALSLARPAPDPKEIATLTLAGSR